MLKLQRSKHYVNTLSNQIFQQSINYRFSETINHSSDFFQLGQSQKSSLPKKRLFHQSLEKLSKIKQLTLFQKKIKRKLAKQRQSQQKRKNNQVLVIQELKMYSHNRLYLVKFNHAPQIYIMKKVQLDSISIFRQVEILKKLKSPFIVKMLHSYENHQCSKRYVNIIMERYPYNLQQIIKTANIDFLTIKIYSYQIIRAIAYIHSKKICHRDIKPNNFLIYKKKIVLCDFGSAKILNSKSISYVGSRYYRAPQMILGAENYQQSVDIWSAGCTLAEMLIKKPLFKGCNNVDQLIKILEILGTPQWRNLVPEEKVPKLPKFVGQTIQAILPRQTDLLFIDLLKKMLIFQPKNRINALNALIHPFFDQIRQQQFNCNIIQKFGEISNLLHFQKDQLNNKQDYYAHLVPAWKRNRNRK